MKTATKKAASRGMLTGEGATVKEAKDNLNAKIDAALEGSYEPVVLSYNGEIALVYRSPDGWRYNLIHLPEGPHHSRVTCWHNSKDETVNYAAYHIIQNACDVQKIRTDADLPEWFTDREKRSDLLGWCRWQRAAAHAQANGEKDVHAWACAHAQDDQFA